MALNLLKKYNQLLDILGMNENQRKYSLLGVFNRDIRNNSDFYFRRKPIHPTPVTDGEIAIETLFIHLTTQINNDSGKREYDYDRSVRLHWIRYHIEEKNQNDTICFSVKEPQGIRTYIYDKNEKYVIVLEPLRKGTAYYLLTAYFLKGKDAQRNSIMKKYKRKLEDIY